MQSAILPQGFALPRSRSAPQGFALPRSRSARARLESALGERISAPFTDIERRTLETVPTGIAPLDALMGGLPRGGITELFGPPSSGCTSVMISILAEATAREEGWVLVVMSSENIVKSAAALVLRMEKQDAQWSTLLNGFNFNIEIVRSRKSRPLKSYVRVHLHSECVQ